MAQPYALAAKKGMVVPRRSALRPLLLGALMAGVMGVWLVGWMVLVHAVITSTHEPAPAAGVAAAAVSGVPAEPIRVVIPSIGVDASVVGVGRAQNGAMAVPSGVGQYRSVGWYRNGVRPGEAGSAALAGHLDGRFGTPAVFARLHELGAGDAVELTDAAGKSRRFVVEAVETYDRHDAPLSQIFAPAGEPRIALITCAGQWDAAAHDYRERLVVYARLEAGA